MAPNVFEKLVPGVAELRARERFNRGYAFAGLTLRVCGIDILPLTPASRLELLLMQNAFVSGAAPLHGDIFVLLWLLHPARDRRPGLLAQVANTVRQFFLRRKVRRLNMQRATRDIGVFLVEQMQDLPEHTLDGADHSPWVHWVAGDASWWLSVHGGFTLESYLRTPFLVLQQLYRGYRIQHPDISRDANGEMRVEEPTFINASDRVIGEWHASQRQQVAAVILANRFRAE